ncbi:hypothetical protein [Streptomyces exfoliatus]|uniref:hypothetical protein n=1 Tax=Streptomyces exfoliatus TaxID=1905 RepID=UPI003C2B06D4
MDGAQSLSLPAGPGAVLRWARATGLVADEGEERRLAAMKIDMLAFLAATLRWLAATGRFTWDAGFAPVDALGPPPRRVGCCPTDAVSDSPQTTKHGKGLT